MLQSTKFKLKREKFNWKINQQIRAPEVRVLSDEGKQLGVMKLSEALKKAHEESLDLIEIAPMAKPPVAKITDLGKFKYQQEKKLKKQKKANKGSELKEVRFSPFIGDKDYETRMKRVREFLEEGNKVRIVVVFLGRHMGSKQFGYSLLEKITGELGDKIAIDMKPKFLGRHLQMGISPVKVSKKVGNKKYENKTKN